MSYFKTYCNPYEIIMNTELFEIPNGIPQVDTVSKNTSTTYLEYSLENDNRIHFYASTNFRDLLFTENTSTNCKNFPRSNESQWVTNVVGSVKTFDCVLIYSNHDCRGRSIKVMDGESSNLTKLWETTVTGPQTFFILYNQNTNWTWVTSSFRQCNLKEGGLELNIDVTQYQADIKQTPEPEVLIEYKPVCGCQTLPKHIRMMDQWSIHNYGNSLIAYFEEDCVSNNFSPLWIPPVISSFSIGLGKFQNTENATGSVHKVQSFGPDFEADYFRNNCVKLQSTVMRIEIMEPQQNGDGLANFSESDVEMTASRTFFRNNGPSQLTQQYTATKTVLESFIVEVGAGLVSMQKVIVDDLFEVNTRHAEVHSEYITQNETTRWNVNIPFLKPIKKSLLGIDLLFDRNKNFGQLNSSSNFHEAKIKEVLQKSYENSIGISTLMEKTLATKITRTFSVTQTITVPACTEQSVSAFVRMTRVHRETKVLAKVSGYIGRQKMSTNQLKKYLGHNLVYVGDNDGTTVLAYSSGHFQAEYGISSVINSEGSTLHDCVERNEMVQCVLCEKCS